MSPNSASAHATPWTQRFEARAPWIAAALVSLPVALSRQPPSTDLAHFEMLLSAMAHHGDAVRFPGALYRLDLGNANQLVFALAWPFAKVFSAAIVVRVALAALVAALPIAAARIADHHGRSRLSAALAASLALGFGFRWGLLAYLLGVALFLLAWPSLDDFARAPTPARAARASLWCAALATAHLSTTFFVAPALVILAAGTRFELRKTALRLAPLTVTLAITALGARRFDGRASTAFRASREMVFGLEGRVIQAPFGLLGIRGPAAYAPFVLAVVATAFLARDARGAAALTDDGAPAPPWQRLVRAHRLALLSLALFAQWAAWPTTWHGAGLLHLRFLTPAAVFGLLALAPPRGRGGRLSSVASLASPAAVVLALAPLFIESSDGFRALDRLIPSIARGSAVVELNFTEAPGSLSLFNHAHAHVVAVKGGRSDQSFAALPQYPVAFAPGAAWPMTAERLIEPLNFAPSVDFRRFRYALVRLPEAEMLRPLAGAMAPWGTLVASCERWSLFESRLPVSPPTAPEEALSTPPRPTLSQLLRWVR